MEITADQLRDIRQGKPVIVEHPKSDYYIVKNKPVTVSCKAAPVIQINIRCIGKWLKLYETQNSDVYDPSSGITFKETSVKITRDQVDEYFGFKGYWCDCRVWGSVADPTTGQPPSVFSRRGHVHVAYMFRRFQREPINTAASVSSQVQLSCIPPRAIPVPEVHWTRNGNIIDPANDTNFLLSADGNLIINQARLENSGQYECVAQNLASKRASGPATLTIYVNGDWSAWNEWTDCSAYCGQGVRKRTRTCTNPAPFNGGKECEGLTREETPCNTICPVNGSWGPWQSWSSCSLDCKRYRRRHCTSPSPNHGGNFCFGNDLETNDCNKDVCNRHDMGVNGSWGSWQSWSSCSSDCKRYRRRYCKSPSPNHGGGFCLGNDLETNDCNKGVCNRNGMSGIDLATPKLNAVDDSADTVHQATSLNPHPLLTSDLETGSAPRSDPSTPLRIILFGSAGLAGIILLLFGILLLRRYKWSKDKKGSRSGSFMFTQSGGMFNPYPDVTLPVMHMKYSGSQLNITENPMATILPSAHQSTNGDLSVGSPRETSNSPQANGTGCCSAFSERISRKHFDVPCSPSFRQHSTLSTPLNRPPQLLPPPPPSYQAVSCESSTERLLVPVTGNSISNRGFNIQSPQGLSKPKQKIYDTLYGLKSSAHHEPPKRSPRSSTQFPASLSDSNAFATGIISHLGGRLTLPESGVSLTVPPNCAMEAAEFFIGLCRDEKDRPRLSDGQTILSPIIVWGARSSQLSKAAVISFHHCASMKHDSSWHYTLFQSLNSLDEPPQWQHVVSLGEETINTPVYCQVDPGICHVMCEQPSRLCLVGCSRQMNVRPATKVLRLAAFGPQSPSTNDLSVRVYVLEDTKDALENVVELERMLGADMIETPRQLRFHDNGQSLFLTAKDVCTGWSCKPAAKFQEIPFYHIWSGSHNTLHCSFMFQNEGQPQCLLSCSISAQQTSPKGVPADRNASCTLQLQCSTEKILNSKKPHQSAKGAGCRSSSGFGSMMTLELSQQVFRISPTARLHLCALLDPAKTEGNDWRMLARALGVDRYINYFATKNSPSDHIFDLWEARNRQEGALSDLVQLLHLMERSDCARIALNNFQCSPISMAATCISPVTKTGTSVNSFSPVNYGSELQFDEASTPVLA